MQLNDKTHLQAVNMSWKVPVFLFCFSPYCGHCKSVHPFWTQMSEDFKDDPKLIVAELDCVQYNSICSNYYKVQAYPTFFTILKGNPIAEKKLERTYDGLSKRARNLRKLNMDELCNKWNESDIPKHHDEYPLVVINHTGTLKEACAFIENLCQINKYPQEFYYARPQQKEMSLSVFFNEKNSLKMNKSFSNENISLFLQEYTTQNFQKNKWSDIMQKKRALVVLILQFDTDVNDFHQIAGEFNHKYYFAYTLFSTFQKMGNKLSLTGKDLPAAIISNEKKNKFIKKTQVTSDSLRSILQMEFSQNKGIKNKKLKQILYDPSILNKKDPITRLTLVGIVLAIAIIIIISGYFLTNDMAINKIE